MGHVKQYYELDTEYELFVFDDRAGTRHVGARDANRESNFVPVQLVKDRSGTLFIKAWISSGEVRCPATAVYVVGAETKEFYTRTATHYLVFNQDQGTIHARFVPKPFPLCKDKVCTHSVPLADVIW